MLSYGREVYHIAQIEYTGTKTEYHAPTNHKLPWYVTDRQIRNDLDTETFAEHIDGIRDANKHVLLLGKQKRPSQK